MRIIPIKEYICTAKRNLPLIPTYALRQPAAQNLTQYSTTNTTIKIISCKKNKIGIKFC